MSSVLGLGLGGGKMEGWGVSKMKSCFFLILVILLMMVSRVECGCIEEERKALLLIKTSLLHSFPSVFKFNPLPSWIDDGGEYCCDWERVKCNTTTSHITHLSFTNIMGITDFDYYNRKSINWPLNVSLFLHFKELTSLNLSFNCLDGGFLNTGLERLSNLNKLEMLDLSWNSITTVNFPPLGALTSLRVLNISYNRLEGYLPDLALENLEILDLSNNYRIQGVGRLSSLNKLKILDLSDNNHIGNETFSSLGALTSLEVLNLSGNEFEGYFPALALENLEILDLSYNYDMKGFEQISLLKKLKSLNLKYDKFNASFITSLRALPMLKSLYLSGNTLAGLFPVEELSHLPRNLKVLILRNNGFNGTLPIEAFTSFHHLEVLDLSGNNFVGSIPSTIKTLLPSSIRVVSFAYNILNGSLLGLCELKNLHELELRHNMFDGNLPQCFNRLSSLKALDISSNQITGTLPSSLIANLTSLEYVDFSDNEFEGAFSFSSFSSHTNLELVRFISNNDKFEMETEEPKGWIPMFQLRVLVLSGCNINRLKGSVVPGFLLHQRMLRIIDLSNNSLVGEFPNRLIENNTMLEALNLRNNSFGNTICMPLHTNANLKGLDMSENHMTGSIPGDIQKFFPYLIYLNLSSNYLNGSIPSSIGDLSKLTVLDLSNNHFSGEVAKGIFTNRPYLEILKLSKNLLHGKVLSGNLSFGKIELLALDNNGFTGKIGNMATKESCMEIMDISNNFFTGTIPHWISNDMSRIFELVARNNSLDGRFPCGNTTFTFLDISQNSFSGPIPSCLNFQYLKHLHLGSNKFSGSIPNGFRNLTGVLTLDIGNNSLSGRIPKVLGYLYDLRVLILRENNFNGSIPKQLCQLSNVSLIDLSSNSISGSIPSCLLNIIQPINPVFIQRQVSLNSYENSTTEYYQGVLLQESSLYLVWEIFEIQDQVQFTTKTQSLSYKGHFLDLMAGLDLSCNKLVGEIPKELGLLTHIHSLNLSHNHLTGTIPMQFSNLENIESLDLSYNGLTGNVPSELIKLNSLAFLNVSYNNLSGGLPDMKAQFSTFTNDSYKGNPLLCGLPLEKKCTPTSQVTDPLDKEGGDKWYDIDMVSFYGSSGATWVVFLLGFVAVLYINSYWRRRWLDFVEECMYTCYYFLDDSVRKLSKLFRK